MDKKPVTTTTMSTKKKAKRLGRLKLTDFDSDTESVQMSRYLESEACASLYRNLKIRPADDKYICLDDDLFRDKSRRLSDSIHLRLSIDHLDIAAAASPSEAETGPPQPRSSGMDESEAISNGFATISGLDDDNSLDNSRSSSSNDERNKSSSLESLILIDDDDDENDSNNRTAASNSNNNNNTNDAGESSEDECHIVQPDRVDQVKPAKSRNVHLQRVEKGILDNETNKINTFNKSIFIGVKVLALKDPVAFRWSVATLKRISDSSLLSSQATPGHGANYRESLQSLVSKTKYYVEFDEEQQQQDDSATTTIANINRRIRDFYIEDENLNSNGGNQSEVETEKENEVAGSSPSSSSSKRSSASASGGVNNRCRKSPSGVKLSRTKSHHQLTTNQQQWQDLNGGGTFGSMNNLSGISTANKSSNEVELDSKSIALLNNYESFVKAVVTTKMTASPTMFEPSHRVVTVCTTRIRSGNRQLVYESDYLCSGTIVEVPNTLNGGRYLIFFDNGVTGYVRPTLVFPILDLAKFPVDRFNLDHMRFIEYYFREYPNRKMIQTRPGQRINVFFDGSWYSNSTVIDIDASLMEVQISSRGTASEHKNWLYSNPTFSFWIYRGSLTIANILENLLERDRDQSSVETKQFCHYIKRRTQLLNEPIQMLQGNLKNYISMFASTLVPNKPPHCHPDSVFASYENRTSSSGMHKSGTSSSLSGMSEKTRAPQQAQGQLKLLDLDSHIRTEPIIFVSHACTPSCVQKWEAAINYIRHINPLLIPQFHGWQRLVNTQSKTSHNGTRKSVNYIAPCGRLMRSCTDVDKYLMLTNSRLTVDMFSFDSAVMSNREFEANCRFLKVEDIANGRENMPISCVNCVDESRPEQFEYSAVRIPVGDVPFKIDHEELEGCNCKDNCRDKMNCSCWRKTFEATLFMGEEKVDTNVGYKNRRLYDMVNTGIFECNPKCKCDCRCVNRVVQNGISIRLQLFKTPKKGWGLRCLDDLPKGTFVCTYEGEILTEQMSDVRGTEIGDVYFAELDFVECLRTNRITSNLNESINNDMENTENTNNRNKPIKPVPSNHDLSVSKYQRPKQQPRPYQNPLSNEAEVIVLDSDEEEDDIIRITRVTDETVFTATSSTTTTTTTTYGGANRVSETAAVPELSERKKQKIKNQQMKIKSITNQVDSNRFFTNPSNPFYIERFIADRSIYVMDAMLKGNAGRYFNHSCTPNIFVQNVFIDSYDLKFPYIAFFTTQAIKAGTELCWDYNYTIGSVQGKRLICHCGTSNCRGRLL